jgi:hypothetical protein
VTVEARQRPNRFKYKKGGIGRESREKKKGRER